MNTAPSLSMHAKWLRSGFFWGFRSQEKTRAADYFLYTDREAAVADKTICSPSEMRRETRIEPGAKPFCPVTADSENLQEKLKNCSTTKKRSQDVRDSHVTFGVLVVLDNRNHRTTKCKGGCIVRVHEFKFT